MTHYIGIDAHSKTCTAVVLDATGNLKEKSVFDTSEKNLLDFVGKIGKPRKLAYEEKFTVMSRQWPVICQLCSIPGFSTIRASIITAIICSGKRFHNKHKLWAYSRLVRYTDISDGRIYGSREVKGRLELKNIFMGAATSVLQTTSGLRRYYDRLRSQGVGHTDAKKAVARRIAAIALMIMKTGKKYLEIILFFCLKKQSVKNLHRILYSTIFYVIDFLIEWYELC